MITTLSIDEARRLVRTTPAPRLLLAHDEKFNRSLLDHATFEGLVINHQSRKNDSLRSLDLPFNMVLARIAARKNISLCIDLDTLRTLKTAEQANELACIRALIIICRKAGTPLSILRARTLEDTRALLRTLGASSQQASEALAF